MNTEDLEAIELDATIEKLDTVAETIDKLKREEDLLPKAELRKKWTALIQKRERDVKNYKKAKENMETWFKKVKFLENEIIAAEKELHKLQSQIIADCMNFGS